MPEQDHLPDHEGQGLEAPARLIEALRGLEQPLILVPPQIDQAALGRPRVLLAQIRRRLSESGESLAPAEDELPLAARSQSPQTRPAPITPRDNLPEFTPRDNLPEANPRKGGLRFWKFLFWAALIAALAAVVLLRVLHR
jgi:hypothetical protein